MNEAIPYFFFSYSRADTDEYLNLFFDDLRKAISDNMGLAIKKEDPDSKDRFDELGFRDDGLKTGVDWKKEIGTAIQNNGVLVCVYSPNFFSRQPNKQFCGKEFTAFLMRDDGIRYAPGTGEPEKEFQLQGARNILPVMWRELPLMQKRTLPPYVLQSITWSLDRSSAKADLNAHYLDAGMRRIAMEKGLQYVDMVNYFAERIIEMRNNPLPALPAVPDIEKLPNAFWDRPEEHKIDRTKTAAAVVEVRVETATCGPTRMLVIEVRAQGLPDWAPYAGEQSVPALFEEVANQKQLVTDWKTLDPGATDFTIQMLAALQDATDRSIRPIVVVDPRCLANDALRRTLVALLQQPCRAGFLVPVDANDRDAIRLTDQYRNLMRPAESAPDWVVRISVGNIAQFRTAVSSVADDMLARIVKNDQVRQSPPDNAGPVTRPRIANRLDTQVA